MNKNENIEDWYRKELSNYNVEPNQDSWESLANDMDASEPLTDNNISEWYKNEVHKLESSPDYTVWEKLSTKLDTYSVWEKLVLSLNRYEQLIWWRNLALKGSAVFIFLLGSYLIYNDITKKNVSITINNITSNEEGIATTGTNNKKTQHLIKPNNYNANKVNQNTPLIVDRENSHNKYDIKKKESISGFNESNLPKVENIKQSTAEKAFSQKKSANRKPIKHQRANNNLLLASIDRISRIEPLYANSINSFNNDSKTIQLNFNPHQLLEQYIERLHKNSDYLVKKSKNKIVFNNKRFSSHFAFGIYARRIYVGLNAGLKKQGMLSKTLENSPLSNYEQNSLLDFGKNIGTTVGLIVSDKFNLETNINFIATAGYKRKFNDGEASFQENPDLNYTTVSVLAKKMANKSTFDNKKYSSNFIAGVYAGYLRTNYEGYKKYDAGIVLGFEQDRYITKTLLITPGIRYNQGLLNIANELNNYNTSRNFSLEFNLAIKYILLKKG